MERSRILDSLADVIGTTTVAIGAGLSLAPERTGRLLGLTGAPERARVIGAADLALGSMILTSSRIWPRHRWPVLVGREARHLVIVGEYRRRGNPAGMFAMCGLFLVDGMVMALMHKQGTRT